jgi:hypothetical protein
MAISVLLQVLDLLNRKMKKKRRLTRRLRLLIPQSLSGRASLPIVSLPAGNPLNCAILQQIDRKGPRSKVLLGMWVSSPLLEKAEIRGNSGQIPSRELTD